MTINRILAFDAATCALMGLLLVAAAPALSMLLGLPAGLLFYAGLLLFPIAIFMMVLSRQTVPSSVGVRLVILGNAGWVAASLGVFAFTSPNALGIAFVLLQAAVVGALAVAELAASQRNGMRTA